MVPDIIPVPLADIIDYFLCDAILDKHFLQKQVADIKRIGKNPADRDSAELFPTHRQSALFPQPFCNGINGFPTKKVCIHLAYHLCLFRLDNILSVNPAVSVYERAAAGFAALILSPDGPLDIIGNGHTLLLGNGGGDSQQELPAHPRSVDIFLFEPYLNAEPFQFPDAVEQVNRVPCEPADGFRKDDIDLPCPTVLHHLQELIPVL